MKAFIGHTAEIKEHPKEYPFLTAVLDGARAAGWAVDEMGDFPATPLPPPEECRQRIEACQAFVGIVGVLWGSEVPGKAGVSYLQFELDTAQKAGKDILLFVIDQNTPFPAAVAQQQPNRSHAQEQFRRSLTDPNVKIVSDSVTLRYEVRRALERLTAPAPPLSESDFERAKRQYRVFVSAEEYDDAFDVLGPLLYNLDFRDSRHHDLLELLVDLFPKRDTHQVPRVGSPSARATVLTYLARVKKNTGRAGEAVSIYLRALAIAGVGEVQRFWILANLLNALRLKGKLGEAESLGQQLLADPPNKWDCEAYGLYWNGVLRADCGRADQAAPLLRQAQILFEDGEDAQKRVEGISRTYAHLAQLELWLGNPQVALRFAMRAASFGKHHGQTRERIFYLRLVGTARLRLGDLKGARRDLLLVRQDALRSNYFEELFAATIALAETECRENDAVRARHWLDDEQHDRARQGEYALLLADFYNVRAAVHRALDRRESAIADARSAFELAWCDGPRLHYHWGLEQAKRLLSDLQAEPPDMPSAPVAAPPPAQNTLRSVPALLRARAEQRVMFTTFFRRMTGSYRYVPTKFTSLLREDWNAVKALAKGQHVSVSPRFVEIHVDNRCNLSCHYCRGELREILQGHLSPAVIRQLVDDIHALNPSVFIRFSGLIGEPLFREKEITTVFDHVGRNGIRWGLTTNGVRLTRDGVLNSLMSAQYVHVSIDAGSEETYHRLKGGVRGDFAKAINGVENLRKQRGKEEKPEIVVSYLLQMENYRELEGLAVCAESAGADVLEVKMQHFDSRRVMSEQAVRESLESIERIRRSLASPKFRVVAVQDDGEALAKVRKSSIPFTRCYAHELGLSSTISAIGEVQTCCQSYQPTLGAMGNLKKEGFVPIWNSARRSEILMSDPSKHCESCSPSDDFVNRFVHFLRMSQEEDGTFLKWVEEEAIGRL